MCPLFFFKKKVVFFFLKKKETVIRLLFLSFLKKKRDVNQKPNIYFEFINFIFARHPTKGKMTSNPKVTQSPIWSPEYSPSKLTPCLSLLSIANSNLSADYSPISSAASIVKSSSGAATTMKLDDFRLPASRYSEMKPTTEIRTLLCGLLSPQQPVVRPTQTFLRKVTKTSTRAPMARNSYHAVKRCGTRQLKNFLTYNREQQQQYITLFFLTAFFF